MLNVLVFILPKIFTRNAGYISVLLAVEISPESMIVRSAHPKDSRLKRITFLTVC